MTSLEIVFVLLAGLLLGSAVLVVTSRRMVHAALWFVVAFGALACCFLVLTAEFVAWVQVLIYAGAMVVLLLFGIMLTRAPIAPSADADSRNRPAALVVAAGIGAVLVAVVPAAFPGARIELDGPLVAGSAEGVGAALFGAWVWPFEVLSVLLLAALIGAIVLTRSDIGPATPTAPGGGGGEATFRAPDVSKVAFLTPGAAAPPPRRGP